MEFYKTVMSIQSRIRLDPDSFVYVYFVCPLPVFGFSVCLFVCLLLFSIYRCFIIVYYLSNLKFSNSYLTRMKRIKIGGRATVWAAEPRLGTKNLTIAATESEKFETTSERSLKLDYIGSGCIWFLEYRGIK